MFDQGAVLLLQEHSSAVCSTAVRPRGHEISVRLAGGILIPFGGLSLGVHVHRHSEFVLVPYSGSSCRDLCKLCSGGFDHDWVNEVGGVSNNY